jgi:hypothetical protein
MKDKHKFGSTNLYQSFIELFGLHIWLLYKLKKHRFNWRAKDVRLLLLSMCSTGSAILELSKKPEYFYCEIIMLARSFIEKWVNFCYLNVCDDIEFEKFLLHPLYKWYSNLELEKTAGKHKLSLKYDTKESFKKTKNLQRALYLFPRKNLNWSEKSIHKKLDEVANNTNINISIFLMNTLTIYSNASEALHGSLYWCSFHTFLYEPWVNHKNPKEIQDNSFKSLTLLLAQLGSMTHEIIKYLWVFSDIWDFVNNSEVIEKVAVDLMKWWIAKWDK